MNPLRGALIAGASLALLVVISPRALAVSAADADGTPHLLTELQFNAPAGATSIASAAIDSTGWVFGAQKGGSISVQATSAPGATGATVDALEGSYPIPVDGQYIWADYKVAQFSTEDVYIEFWAKMPGAKEGCKFLKIFGKRPLSGTDSYANTTIGADYTGTDNASVRQVAFGDGTTLVNDSQNVINFNGSYPEWIGRSYGTAVVKTPQMQGFSATDWGTGWHHFRIHVKFNSGTTSQNEVPNGEYYVEIDGKVYVDATGLYNRNPADGPIDRIEFFGWAQNGTVPFQLWYDDIRISTGGFVSQALPNPPTNVSAQ